MSQENVEVVQGFLLGPDVDVAPLFRNDEMWAALVKVVTPVFHSEIVDLDGRHYVIETKGREDIDVAHKDRAAEIWCENATLLTSVPWQFVKVLQAERNKLQPSDFAEVQLTFGCAR